jgi:CheY-like chemotaxis protein
MTHKSALNKEPQKRLGEIFLEKGLINEVTLARSLKLSQKSNSKLGKLLEDIGLITGDELVDALASQYGFRVVRDIAGYRYAPELLSLVPVETARKYHIFPLKIDSGRLAIAMSDLTDIKAASDIAEENNLALVPFVASQKDIKAAIDKHYPKHVQSSAPEKEKVRTILLAEDDRLVSTIMQNILVKKGYRVVLAPNGMEAYQLVLKEKPDVILTDKVMPKLDGYALQSALRAQPETRNIPVIMISSSNDNNEEANAFDRGFFDYLSKPVKETTLLVRVERALQYAASF